MALLFNFSRSCIARPVGDEVDWRRQGAETLRGSGQEEVDKNRKKDYYGWRMAVEYVVDPRQLAEWAGSMQYGEKRRGWMNGPVEVVKEPRFSDDPRGHRIEIRRKGAPVNRDDPVRGFVADVGMRVVKKVRCGGGNDEVY